MRLFRSIRFRAIFYLSLIVIANSCNKHAGFCQTVQNNSLFSWGRMHNNVVTLLLN